MASGSPFVPNSYGAGMSAQTLFKKEPKLVLAPSLAAAKAWAKLSGLQEPWELVTSGRMLAARCVEKGPFREDIVKLHGWEAAADEALRQVVAAIELLRAEATAAMMEQEQQEFQKRLDRCERLKSTRRLELGVRCGYGEVLKCEPDGAGAYDVWVELERRLPYGGLSSLRDYDKAGMISWKDLERLEGGR